MDESKRAADQQDDVDLDKLDELEDRYAKELEAEGYREGLEMGKKAGEEEGLALGATEGAKRGSELGYLNGFTMAYKQIYSKEQEPIPPAVARTRRVIDEILRLIEEFPRTNENDCDERLANIRVKFKQAFVGIPHAVE